MAKKELTIEELRAQWEALGAELEEREKAEAEARREKLKAEKEARYKEVIGAYENFEELREKFVEDYGYFTFGYKSLDLSDGFWKACGLF